MPVTLSNPDIREFWLRSLPREYTASKIHHDYKMGERETCASGAISIPFRLNTCSRIREITDNDLHLIQALLGANLSIVLFKYTGFRNIIWGLESASAVLPYWIEVGNEVRIVDLITQTEAQMERLYAHQEEDFDSLYQLLCEKEERNIGPLYDIVLHVDQISPSPVDVNGSMTLSFTLEDDYLKGEIIFKEAFYTSRTIQQFARWYAESLFDLVGHLQGQVADIFMLSKEEINQLDHFGSGRKQEVSNKSFNHLAFQAVAQQHPQRTALVSGDRSMTYEKLNALSDVLATNLPQGGALTGIFTERSFDMIISLLGVLKSGGTYLPIDPTYPTDRLTNMLNAVEIKAIITQKKFERLLRRINPAIQLIFTEDQALTQARTSTLHISDIAYAIFTSGSTGIPKCAQVTHKGWANLLSWFNKAFDIHRQDKCLLVSSFGFDITQRALMMPLIAGAELHLYHRAEYDPSEILSLIEKRGITLLHCTPSSFYPLMDICEATGYSRLASLRYLFLGGEPIQASRLKPWTQSGEYACQIVNVYGVTECTDVSTYYILKDFDQYDRTGVPIGEPIYNTELFVVNDHLDIVPFGMEGELLIGGIGLGKGYIHDEGLTQAKFITHRFGDIEHQLYRTGDVVKFREDGMLLYAGRKDFQVKIRGHRVDLGDLETHILSFPGIKESVVIVSEDIARGRELIAYVLPEERSPGLTQRLWHYLKDKLPSHMVPDQYGLLHSMPLNAHGKLDRHALKSYPYERIQASLKEVLKPIGPLEQYLHEKFRQVLNVEDLSTTDNFFDLGGHSLTATQLIALINKEKNTDLRVIQLLSHPTISALAEYIQHVTINLI
jgi:amino acid adenylation domain-containing protein